MENLTKEDFWNNLKSKYPGEVENFCKWIDTYKTKVNWEKLFNNGSPHYAHQGWHNPKYHDIPVGMQIGIFLQYISETGSENIPYLVAQAKQLSDIKIFIEDYFHKQHLKLPML